MMHGYTLKRSRRKTLSITVKRDCTVEVHAPMTVSKKRIDEFVSSHSKWIENNISKMKAQAEQRESFALGYGTEVCFFGKRLPVKESSVKKAKLDTDCVLMPQGLDGEQIRQRLVNLYKETARIYISERLPYYSQLIGTKPSRLTISSAKTNWGSCTADRVHFSWHLIMAEKEVIDYVIIHELTHIIHHNHSAAFWSEVQKHCPNWKQLRSQLKIYSDILTRENWC